MGEDARDPRPVGIIANPISGRDVRRLAARARTSTPEDKRNQVARVVIGAVAAGAKRVLVMKEPFRISSGAVEHLQIGAELEVIDVGARVQPEDTVRAARAMRDAGCAALVVLGGDGTNLTISKVWADAPLVPISTGTNNVFPLMVEATTAGVAAGLVAAGRLGLEEVARRAKCIEVEIEGGPKDLALVDATLLVNDHVGNLLPFDPERMRYLLLARAEPASIGTSPIGGLLEPCGRDDDFGVGVSLVGPAQGGRTLLAPLSQGLYRQVYVADWRRVPLGESIELSGPAVLALDGDREHRLEPGQKARLRVTRAGPRVIDPERALALAAERELFLDRESWRDAYDEF